MVQRAWLRSAICLAILVSFSGCPGGASVVGAWKIVIDENCADIAPPTLLLLIYQDGTFEIAEGGFDIVSGTWSASGGDITLDNEVAGITGFVTFVGVVTGASIEGTYSGDTDGCWSADRIII